MTEDSTQTCKVVLLGETSVGKTSIISRYTTNSFEMNNLSTSGASYANKPIELKKYNKTIKFEIWDTAGQEKYRALTKIFYKKASVAILVYDITKKQTFNEIKNYWYNQVKNSTSNEIIIAIAANKSDLYEFEQVNEEEARKYAKEIGAIFFVTSALNSSGIDELFRAIGCKFVDKEYDYEEDDEGNVNNNNNKDDEENNNNNDNKNDDNNNNNNDKNDKNNKKNKECNNCDNNNNNNNNFKLDKKKNVNKKNEKKKCC